MSDVTYSWALLAGLLSFLSPCVLPLVPPYLTYLAGATIEELTDRVEPSVQRRAIVAALLFVAGFSTVFVLLGASASFAGQLLREYSRILSIAAGLAIVVMGLHFLGLFRISLLYREARFQAAAGGKLIGAYVMGLAFAFGWTPCIGPALQVVLTLALNEATALRGAVLALCYALGLGLPFLIAGFAFDRMAGTVEFVRRHHRGLQVTGGVMMIAVGVLLITGGWDVLMAELRQWASAFGTVI